MARLFITMDSSRTYTGAKISWLLPLRLVTFTLIFGIIVWSLDFPSYMATPFLLYGIVTLAALLTLTFIKRYNLNSLFRFLLILHFALEIANEAGIFYTTGSLYSPFSALFLLTIVSSALVYRLVGTLLIASVVSLVYSVVTWINASMIYPEGEPASVWEIRFFDGDDAFFYSTFLHILIFYTVAFISGYLAEKLQSKHIELDSTSRELKNARLDTGDILRHLNCGVITINRAGEVVYFNRTAEIILGLNEADISGRHCRDAFTGSLEELANNLIETSKSNQRLSRSELNIIGPEQKPLPLGLSTSTMYDENFEIRGVIAIFQDLTEAKIMEEKIRQSDRMAAIGELSACIAHEIRNPLASISGSVEILKQDLELDGDDEKLMSLIIKESSRLNKILSDFLLYARVSRPQLQKVELNHLIFEVVELIRRHPACNDHIIFDLPPAGATTFVAGDEDQLKQTLLNLVVNGCEAFDGGPGQIKFEIENQPGSENYRFIRLEISDNGPGIPADQIPHIFLPFHSTKKTGTGLGLSIVSRLVEAHNGRIEVKSAVGVGTEFTLYLRRFDEPSIISNRQSISTSATV